MPPIITVCPSCGAKNRVQSEKLAAGPACGKCQSHLVPGRPVELTAQTFDRFVSGQLPVLVDFWAPWCGPCRAMAPAFAEAAQRLAPQVVLAKLDTEAHPEPGGRFGIRSIPTMVLFRQGQEAARQAGAMPAAQIEAWTRQHL